MGFYKNLHITQTMAKNIVNLENFIIKNPFDVKTRRELVFWVNFSVKDEKNLQSFIISS